MTFSPGVQSGGLAERAGLAGENLVATDYATD
jgi:hypothetical protein